jgi:hypothetical protein
MALPCANSRENAHDYGRAVCVSRLAVGLKARRFENGIRPPGAKIAPAQKYLNVLLELQSKHDSV